MDTYLSNTLLRSAAKKLLYLWLLAFSHGRRITKEKQHKQAESSSRYRLIHIFLTLPPSGSRLLHMCRMKKTAASFKRFPIMTLYTQVLCLMTTEVTAQPLFIYLYEVTAQRTGSAGWPLRAETCLYGLPSQHVISINWDTLITFSGC